MAADPKSAEAVRGHEITGAVKFLQRQVGLALPEAVLRPLLEDLTPPPWPKLPPGKPGRPAKHSPSASSGEVQAHE